MSNGNTSNIQNKDYEQKIIKVNSPEQAREKVVKALS
jgi:hypothetical protein